MASPLSKEAGQYMARSERTLEAAQVLAEHGYWRDVLSKTYFAMFYAASALLCADGISVSKHSAVVALVGERFAKPRRIQGVCGGNQRVSGERRGKLTDGCTKILSSGTPMVNCTSTTA